MKKEFDITALGECLIDFTPYGTASERLFQKNAGGAPANLLAMAAKLGSKTAFIGKVGQDSFGDFLVNSLKAADIDTRGLLRDKKIPTTLAFVHLDSRGERSFSFYRHPGADIMLSEQELPEGLLHGCRIFHFSGVALTDEPCRSAALSGAKRAQTAGALVSFDPNYRPLLWQSKEQARQTLFAALECADIVKVSQEELLLLSGCDDPADGAKILLAAGPKAILISCGEQGAFYADSRFVQSAPALTVQAVDTTGAGDAFFGAILHRLALILPILPWEMDQKSWRELLIFGCTAGSLTATRPGAIPALPDKKSLINNLFT